MMLALASGWSSGHRKSRVLVPLGYLRVDTGPRNIHMEAVLENPALAHIYPFFLGPSAPKFIRFLERPLETPRIYPLSCDGLQKWQ